MNTLFLLILSVLSAYGISIALTYKGSEWPLKWLVNPLRGLLGRLNPNAPGVFDCAVCLSFWTSLLTDLSLLLVTRGHYFAWPLSGFITVGFTWTVLEFFKNLDHIGGGLNLTEAEKELLLFGDEGEPDGGEDPSTNPEMEIPLPSWASGPKESKSGSGELGTEEMAKNEPLKGLVATPPVVADQPTEDKPPIS
jgi:hypothetical protein